MTFLAVIDARQQQAKQRFTEIRKILAEAIMPGPTEHGLSCALKLPLPVHDRLEEACGRHGLRSLKETAYKAMMLGLATMERLPATDSKLPSPRASRVTGRPLTDEEISRIKDEGFNAPRVRPPEKHYCDRDDDEELRAVAG